MTDDASQVIFYGTSWCYSSRKARALFEENSIPYLWIDIDYDEEGRSYVEKVNRGFRSVPTIVFPDGTILVEPSNEELRQKLGLA